METITNKTRTAMNTHLSTSSSRASRRAALRLAAAALFAATVAFGDLSSGMKALPNHVPAAVAHSKATGILPPTARSAAGHRFAVAQTPAVWTSFWPRSMTRRARITGSISRRSNSLSGSVPPAEDYQAVMEFAQANGLSVAATHRNRLLLDVTGSVADIQRAFHVTLRTYRHPSEARDFFAPDTRTQRRGAVADMRHQRLEQL